MYIKNLIQIVRHLFLFCYGFLNILESITNKHKKLAVSDTDNQIRLLLI